MPPLPRPDAFLLPKGVYLDGNSLGPLTYAAQAAIERRLRQWQVHGVGAWDDWFGLAERLSPAIGRLVGAHPDEVIATASITVNLHALLATFHRPEGRRRHLLATALDFPTDLHALQSWAELRGVELRLMPSRDGHTLADDDLDAALTDDVAFAWLPTVLYRSGQALDVARWTRVAHERGTTVGWDAAHSIGALPHALHDDGVDVAAWCSYKYLNGGPGAPGGLFVHRRHHDVMPALRGWWGHDKATQFAMAPTFARAPAAAAFQLGTPPVLSLAGLEGALALYEEVGIEAVRARSLALTDALIARVDATLPELEVVTPRAHARRGGHVALRHPEAARLSRALRRRGVVPDFRQPDVLRLAPVAWYTSEADLDRTVAVLRELLDGGAYLDEVVDGPIG
ncbi:MAG: kynureninase [Trueperaceae bacterium]|nr:kynureninase [Trueperaceae bacterium]